MTHWATQYIGIPYERGATGPCSFDCLGFARYIQKTYFGRILPGDSEVPTSLLGTTHAIHEAALSWHEEALPEEGDCVLLGRRNFATHVGIWVSPDTSKGVLHCVDGIGVIYQRKNELSVHGWPFIRFMRPRSL